MRAARDLPSGLNSVRIEAGQCQCTLMTRSQFILRRAGQATGSAKTLGSAAKISLRPPTTTVLQLFHSQTVSYITYNYNIIPCRRSQQLICVGYFSIFFFLFLLSVASLVLVLSTRHSEHRAVSRTRTRIPEATSTRRNAKKPCKITMRVRKLSFYSLNSITRYYYHAPNLFFKENLLHIVYFCFQPL